ncbi:MAG: glycosyltransferase [Alphaproteobacteria bacterium]
MAQKLKTMQLRGAPKAGGAETIFVRLMVALSKRKDVVLMPVVRKGGWAAKRLTEEGVPHQTAWFGGWWDVFSAFKIKHLALGFEPDVVMGWMNRGTAFVPASPATPKGASQDAPSFASRQAWATVARLGGYYKLKNYRGRVEHLIGNTQDIVDYCVKEGWAPEKTAFIGNFTAAPKAGWRGQRGAVRGAYGIAEDAYVMLVAGRIHSVKGIDVALKALAALPEKAVLLVAGEGPEKAAMQALAAELGVEARVRWAGWVDDVSRVAAAADVWLVPSRHEPLGNVVLDAWAHGLPVVATRSAGPVSLIRDGETGVLVGIDDVSGFVDAVGGLMAKPKRAVALAAAGEAEYVEKYGEDVVVERFVEYYKGLKRRKM